MWLGFGWPARGALERRDTAFESLVELSTRVREARLVISQVTTWSDPLISNFDYTNYLAGVRALVGPEKRRTRTIHLHILRFRCWLFRVVGVSWTKHRT